MSLSPREVRTLLKNKTDPAVAKCIEVLADDVKAIGQQIISLAQTIDKLIDIVSAFQSVAGEMQGMTEKMKNIAGTDKEQQSND